MKHQFTTCDEINTILIDLPGVWYALLLQTIVREGYKKESFPNGGASDFVKLIEKRINKEKEEEK